MQQQPALAPAPHPGEQQQQQHQQPPTPQSQQLHAQQQSPQQHQQQPQQQQPPQDPSKGASNPNVHVQLFANPWLGDGYRQDHDEQVLQESLLHHAGHPAPPPPRPQPGMAHVQPIRDHSNIDPAISGAPATTGMIPVPPQQLPPQQQQAPQTPEQVMMDAPTSEGRKSYGKRELSTSKRAAQNRAAQRAFRQRKEGYIRKLEEQVKEYEIMSQNFKALQTENYQLREYIIGLQSRLIDTQGDVPDLPANIDLTQPRPDPTAAQAPNPAGQPGQLGSAPGQPEQMDLNRIAVAGLGMRKHQHEEAAFLGNNFPAKQGRRDMGVDEQVPTDPKLESAQQQTMAA